MARLAARTPEDTTNLVLVLGRARDARGGLWIRARLPTRTVRTGWLPRSALGGYEEVHTRLIVDRARLTLTLLRNGRAVFRAPVGIGRAATPTPAGDFYVRDRLKRYASPVYGPVAFGTSAQSATLTDWPAGGYVGIHGTNQPELVPGRVSHGCIRLRNADIRRLARLLPVGTPLEIQLSRTLPASCPTSTALRAGACARAWPPRSRPAPAPAATSASSRSPASSRGCGSSTSAAARWACGGSSPASTSRASTSPRARDYPGPFVQADATERLPFDDGAFDLAYSSSVVEHVDPARRAAFAGEIRRVARGWFVQTPAWSFPIEPHALLPVAHWLPATLRRPYWRLGAAGAWEDIALLRRAEMVALFGEPVHAERLGGVAKSWIALRAIDTSKG